MATRVLLQHTTKYIYDSPVFLSTQLIRLKPAVHYLTSVEAYSLLVTPINHQLRWQQDPFGNFLARVDFTGAVQQLEIDVTLIATILPTNPFNFLVDDYAQFFPFSYEDRAQKDLCAYLEITDKGPMMLQLLKRTDTSKREIIDFLVMLVRLVYETISYTERLQPGVQTSEESLEKASGSCRDSAWLMVQLLRNVGMAARFVSGYLVELADDSIPGVESTPGTAHKKDTFTLHAWAEVYIPGAGWIGLDPTGGLLTAEGHIPLACTPSPDSAAPVTGTSGISNTLFTHSNTITRI